MEDRFKFRGWDGAQMLPEQDLTQNGKYWGWLGKNDVILMQCTGLRDKNGTLIYEGDIVTGCEMQCGITCSNIEVVSWDKDIAGFSPVCLYDCDCDIYQEPDIMEIIGNIYENPELLEESK